MKKTLMLLFLAGTFTFPLNAVTYPQLALGGGYECILLVTNKLETTFDGSFALFKRNRELWDTPFLVNGKPNEDASIQYTLAPLGSTKFLLQSDSDLEIGYLVGYGSGENSGTDVTVSFFYQFVQNGVLIDSVGVSASYSSLGNFFPVEKSAQVNSGFAWGRELALDPFDITLTLYDSGGLAVQEKTIPFTGHMAKFITEVFDDIPDGFIGHVRIVSPINISVIALRYVQVGEGFQLTTTPVVRFSL